MWLMLLPADRDNIPVSRSELHDLLAKPSLSGIPLLVLGNKIDRLEALSQQPLMDQLENVGLLGLNRVGSRRVVQISAAFMLFFSVLGKFGAVLASIFAALYCVLFAFVGTRVYKFLHMLATLA